MANKTLSSLLSIILISSIFQSLAGEAVAARSIHDRYTIDDKKQPQWLIGYDGVSVLIPGIGRVTLSPYDKGSFGGHKGSYGSYGGLGGEYIPGADDTFIPNPGFEVPNPANVGSKKTPHP